MLGRLASQLLAGTPAASPAAVVERLLAVQAQDARGVRLAIRARTRGLTAADVNRALNDGTLVVGWLNRGTLHLVAAGDYRWLHALTTPQLMTSNVTRLANHGVTPAAADRGIARIVKALESGPATRETLRAAVAAHGVATEGQALVQILARASFQGLILRGPMIGRQHAWVLSADWLPRERPIAPARMRAELARRYLRGHAPATDRDLAYWAGISLGTARSALQEIQAEIEETPDGALRLRGSAVQAATAPPRLLGVFDPVLHGWRSRAWVTGTLDPVIATGGLFRPSVLVGGAAAGTWHLAAGRPRLTLLRTISGAAKRALEADADDVVRFLSDPPCRRAETRRRGPPRPR